MAGVDVNNSFYIFFFFSRNTDMEIRNKAKQIIEGVMVQIQAIKNTDHTVNALKTDIV